MRSQIQAESKVSFNVSSTNRLIVSPAFHSSAALFSARSVSSEAARRAFFRFFSSNFPWRHSRMLPVVEQPLSSLARRKAGRKPGCRVLLPRPAPAGCTAAGAPSPVPRLRHWPQRARASIGFWLDAERSSLSVELLTDSCACPQQTTFWLSRSRPPSEIRSWVNLDRNSSPIESQTRRELCVVDSKRTEPRNNRNLQSERGLSAFSVRSPHTFLCRWVCVRKGLRNSECA
jgi:hypothetical protein